jgi:hypothetical protein
MGGGSGLNLLDLAREPPYRTVGGRRMRVGGWGWIRAQPARSRLLPAVSRIGGRRTRVGRWGGDLSSTCSISPASRHIAQLGAVEREWGVGGGSELDLLDLTHYLLYPCRSTCYGRRGCVEREGNSYRGAGGCEKSVGVWGADPGAIGSIPPVTRCIRRNPPAVVAGDAGEEGEPVPWSWRP